MMQPSNEDWSAMLHSPAFRTLTRRRRKTVLLLGVAAAVYYFSIPALIAFAPSVFAIRLLPGINLGAVFAVSQYPFGIALAFVFLKRSAVLDAQAGQLAAAMSLPVDVVAVAPEHRHVA
jgi:uncharacterized membrane protein (DUF485 family)